MTEDEAKTKWCPFARDSETAGNRVRYGAPGEAVEDDYRTEAAAQFPCIASACMAWRWDGTHVNDPDDPKADMVWSDRSYGHCGLAGEEALGRASSLENRRRYAEAPQ